ncbi:ABC transporter permease [Algoriphagus sp. C2-6-M1]|uniref:ABC transporter permease n=1 Tax=Algoriphagus persicinus TaxID=3108754 RepID=UPI002B3E4B71|nr:ABC transporter permease [Algoriphagus sp. C2-6-M1]MEB2782374.1 ABC transporter permease [Algoriphagus sp. C2-6-M1]
MLLHNLLLIYRSFKKFKSTFIINLVGLSTGLACTLLIFLWVRDELSMDKFHENDSRLYQVMEHRILESEIGLSTRTSALTAPTLEEEIPEVEYAVTCFDLKDYTLSVDNKDIQAAGQYVGEAFFKVFSFPLIQGNEEHVLNDRSSIVISESLAKNLFNTTDAVGKTIEWQHEEHYQVTGVFEDVPQNSSMQFDFVLPFRIYMEDAGWASRWRTAWPLTYALLKPGTNVDQLNEKIADLIERKTNGEVTHRILFAAPYSQTYLYGTYENGKQAGGRIDYVRLFSVVAVFILFIASINFMNLSTAKASRRLKEVGIKKAVGAGRSTLVLQYLGESTLMAMISLVVAIGLVVLLLPQFNQITGKQLYLPLDSFLILSFLSITLVTGLIAGSYPALYISAFNPAKVLKGYVDKSVGELWARKGLVVVQFTLSIILIVAVCVVYKQIEFVQNKHLGYNKENVLYFNRLGSAENLETFLSEIRKLHGVVGTSSIGHDMTGHIASTQGVQWPAKAPNDITEFEMMPVNYDMLELLGIEMVAGRTFSREFGTDSAKVLFNEAAIEHMGVTDPIGKGAKVFGEEREIIGVVKNFNFESLHSEVKPVVMWLAPQRTSTIAVKVQAGKEQETIDQLKSLFQTFYPGFPFDFQFLDAEYQAQYIAEQRVSVLSRYFAGIAILISCLGLFGLAAFTAERRVKEIGIRKVLGSSEWKIIQLLSGDFAKMVLVAIFIALPLSYYLTSNWLDGFAYKIDLRWWYFVGAGALTMLIALLTVSFQSIKAALMNPVKSLKSE